MRIRDLLRDRGPMTSTEVANDLLGLDPADTSSEAAVARLRVLRELERACDEEGLVEQVVLWRLTRGATRTPGSPG